MRDPDRIDRMVELLRAAWKRYPDWRLGQMVHNATLPTATAPNDVEPFFCEDDRMEAGLRKWAGEEPKP